MSNQNQGGRKNSGLRNTTLKSEFFLTAKEANTKYFSVHLFVKLLIPFLSATCFFLKQLLNTYYVTLLLSTLHTSINSLHPYSPIR